MVEEQGFRQLLMETRYRNYTFHTIYFMYRQNIIIYNNYI